MSYVCLNDIQWHGLYKHGNVVKTIDYSSLCRLCSLKHTLIYELLLENKLHQAFLKIDKQKIWPIGRGFWVEFNKHVIYEFLNERCNAALQFYHLTKILQSICHTVISVTRIRWHWNIVLYCIVTITTINHFVRCILLKFNHQQC